MKSIKKEKMNDINQTVQQLLQPDSATVTVCATRFRSLNAQTAPVSRAAG